MKTQMLMAAAMLVGGLLSLQGIINANLGKVLPHPLQASFVSFSVGLLCLALVLLLAGVKFPGPATLAGVPWYLYLGGLLGIVYVTTALLLIPEIGVANAVLAIFVGQMLLSIAADHFGWFNMPVRTMDLPRIGGCLLLLAGLYLVQLRG